MAFRRRQGGAPKSTTTFRDEVGSPRLRPPPEDDLSSFSSSSSSLAAKAIRASSAYRDASLSSAYGYSSLSPFRDPYISTSSPPAVQKDPATYEYTSMKNLSYEPKHGLWGVLARKVQSIPGDDNAAQQFETRGRTRQQMPDRETMGQYRNPYHSLESRQKTENPALQKGLDAITSSLNYIGGTIGNAFEEGFHIVENRTVDIIQETRKLQIRKKVSSSEKQNQTSNVGTAWPKPLVPTHVQLQMQTDIETQLKASRDVAMAMAAKSKLLLRELKTFKADLAFAKERCAQLEEENRILRVSLEKGDNPEDDDLIRLQLETLLAEKARLAQENSDFARENRFLREVVEYHQLTMQDVVYLDGGSEEVTEVYPIKVPHVSNMHSAGRIETSTSFSSPTPSSSPTPEVTRARSPKEPTEISSNVTTVSSFIHIPLKEDLEKCTDAA